MLKKHNHDTFIQYKKIKFTNGVDKSTLINEIKSKIEEIKRDNADITTTVDVEMTTTLSDSPRKVHIDDLRQRLDALRLK